MIDKLQRAIARLINTKTKVRDNKKYLQNGNYIFVPGIKPFLFRDNILEEQYYEIFGIIETQGLVSGLINVIKRSIYNFKVHNKETSLFMGNIIMIDRVQDIKIFNTHKRIAISIIEDLDRFQMLRSVYHDVKDFYNIPFIATDGKNQIIIEKFIHAKPIIKWSQQDEISFYNNFFYNLENNTKNQILKGEVVFKNTKDMLMLFEEKFSENDIYLTIKSLLPSEFEFDEWPIIKCHGDVKFDNILLEEEENIFYYIDWEFYNDYIFFYDLFDLIFIEAVNDNYKYIRDFLAGKYDTRLENLFNLFSINYNCKYKEYYIALYLVEKILKVDSITIPDKNNLKCAISEYDETLNRIVLFSESPL